MWTLSLEPALTEEPTKPLCGASAPPSTRVLEVVRRAAHCALERGEISDTKSVTVIDYSLSSRVPRLWVLDLESHRVLLRVLVAHGKNSGEDYARFFSNENGSLQSSMGIFVTGESYVGAHGKSLRLRGLERGINDQAESRSIVIHGAAYVDEKVGRVLGRLGRSFGCPAVSPEVAESLIDTVRGGKLLVSYFPDSNWLDRSDYLRADCGVSRDRRGRAHDSSVNDSE